MLKGKYKWAASILVLLIIIITGVVGTRLVILQAPVSSSQAISAGIAIPASTSMPAVPGKVETPAWLCQHATETANPVQAENNCPGTSRWRVDRPLGAQDAIEGFTSPVSVQAGETIKLYVSTTAPTYTFEVYRMGWYNGSGGRLVYSSAQLPGIAQPAPIIDPATRMVSCANWRTQMALLIPKNWVSGVYLIKLLAGQYMRYISFVVRDDASHSAILFQTSVLTYEAYNTWGGYSLYTGPAINGKPASWNRAYAVSFDRPDNRGDGAGDFPIYNEYNMLRWLERSGYDVSYTTDVDTDQHQAPILQHRLFMAAGHDEYWSAAMRTHVTAARDAGVSLAFWGGDDMYWHVRLQSSPLGVDREVICYKINYYGDKVVDPLEAIHPDQTTALWRSAPLNQPENALLGAMFVARVAVPVPLVISGEAQPFLAGTSLHTGSSVDGVIGGEYDQVFHNAVSPSDLVVLAASPVRCIASKTCPANGNDTANATLYTAASGARVFDAGTFYWGWGLDDNVFDPALHLQPVGRAHSTSAFQQFTANLLAYLLR